MKKGEKMSGPPGSLYRSDYGGDHWSYSFIFCPDPGTFRYLYEIFSHGETACFDTVFNYITSALIAT